MEEWLKLLVQVPIVAAFIWYSLEMNKRGAEAQAAFMAALDKRDEAFDKRNEAVVTAIGNINAAICMEMEKSREFAEEHDKWVRVNTPSKKVLSKLPLP